MWCLGPAATNPPGWSLPAPVHHSMTRGHSQRVRTNLKVDLDPCRPEGEKVAVRICLCPLGLALHGCTQSIVQSRQRCRCTCTSEIQVDTWMHTLQPHTETCKHTQAQTQPQTCACHADAPHTQVQMASPHHPSTQPPPTLAPRASTGSQPSLHPPPFNTARGPVFGLFVLSARACFAGGADVAPLRHRC